MFFRHHGATELAFTSIVGHGPNAALPHYLPSKDALLEAENLVLVDVGCRLEDYCSDQTRTFWVGEKPTERFKKDAGGRTRSAAQGYPGYPSRCSGL